MPFRKIVQASQHGAVMSSYNEINGVPSAANSYLNDTLMRETFGLQGYFTGDCDAVNQVNTRHHWQPDGFGHIATVVEQFAFTLALGRGRWSATPATAAAAATAARPRRARPRAG